jgi:deoxyribodipyrimidine photo-lyase
VETKIIWIRNQLRLNDLLPASRAEANAAYVLVYFLPDEQPSPLGLPRMGESRKQFLFESLSDLDQQLKLLGSKLCVFREAPETKLPELAQQLQASEVLIPIEPGTEEATSTQRVQTALNRAQVDWMCYPVNYLIDPSFYQHRSMPKHFTDFRKEVEQANAFGKRFNSPLSYLNVDAIELPSWRIQRENTFSNLVKGGRTAAMERLTYYFEQPKLPSSYKETRNESLGMDYSTKFSPWLSLGCLTPLEILEALKAYEAKYGANESTYWIQFELLWRDFFRLSAEVYGKKLFMAGGVKGYNKPLTFNAEVFDTWRFGQTESDFVNAHLLELLHTGFMSNRGRQNVASYWIHELQQDWRIGAYWFEHQLLDYDVASNWGNWAYIAGVGSDPRGGRKFSIEKQAATYDAQFEHRKHWLTYAT